jgi:hypothetical protein
MTSMMMMKSEKKTLKIACCSVPDSGHMNPIMNLVRGLVTKRNDDDDSNNYEICVFTLGEDGHKKYQKQCECIPMKKGKNYEKVKSHFQLLPINGNLL